MANLKRNMIELVKNPEEVLKGGEPEFEKYWTPAFIPFKKVREGLQLSKEFEKDDASELEAMDKLADFTVDVYGKQFTKDYLLDHLHGPDALRTMQENLMFISQGAQNDETKAFLNNKKRG